MKTLFTPKIIITIVAITMISTLLVGQDNEKEVIIIEKTVDADGNVVSKNIKRNRGNYTEDDIQEMIEDDGDMPTIRSFDLEGMGWGDDMRSMFSPRSNKKPTLGVVLKVENDQLVVTSVAEGSGAENADIRPDDKIISVDNLPVASVEEIQEILAQHDYGDKAQVVIWRDGQEIEKDILLKSNSFQGLFGGEGFEGFSQKFFDTPNGGIQFFGDMGDMDMDSLLSRFRNMSPDIFDFDGFDMGELRRSPNSATPQDQPRIGEKTVRRPQLGLFIEDTGDGIEVTEVIADGAADQAGIREGDILTHIDDNMVLSYRELSAWMNTKSFGDDAVITVERNGKSKDLNVTFK